MRALKCFAFSAWNSLSKAALVIAVLVLVRPTFAQEENQGKYVNSAAARLVKLVNLANNDGYQLQNNSFSIGGGWIPQSSTWTPLFTLNMVRDRSYRIITVGDMDSKDVDVQVLDDTGRVVASDTAVSQEAIVHYRPTRSGRYTIQTRVYASQGNSPCVTIAIVMLK